MSRNINVNPAHYKLRGRERQGEDILHDLNKQVFARQADADRWHEQQQAPPPPHPPEQAAAEVAQLKPVRARRKKARKPKQAGARRTAARTTRSKKPVRKRGRSPSSRARTGRTGASEKR
jgi:hypothetical protein